MGIDGSCQHPLEIKIARLSDRRQAMIWKAKCQGQRKRVVRSSGPCRMMA